VWQGKDLQANFSDVWQAKDLAEIGVQEEKLRSGSGGAERAEARSSHAIIAQKEYEVNNYLYGINRSTGGSGPSGWG
jgi:hypothetical protein